MHSRCAARCDNRDKLDDNAIPISEVGRRDEERERLFIKKGSLGGLGAEKRMYVLEYSRTSSNLQATILFLPLVLFRAVDFSDQ